ncbi:MAG TPA: hypothetical protein VMU49_02730 [Candidatus Acidoferrales bacterium]|nr:hypothetical protein [Candidatus Acidoferrales bacterium]
MPRLRVRYSQLAVGLGQIGEFSFVLSSLASAAGLISRPLHAALLASVAFTIAASAVLVRLGYPRPAADQQAV